MKLYTLKRTQLIKHPREEVFKFFKKPENLEKITPVDVGFAILTPLPIEIHTGTILDYKINLLGFHIRWTTLITNYSEPEQFTDVALKGPYSFWHHRHTFEESEKGTIMTDEVTYAIPFGILGRLTHKFWIKKQLENIFDYRAQVISSLFSK